MLVDKLFTFDISTPEEGKVEASVNIHADNPIFSGHFPGNPVTPGVMQIQLVQEVLEQALGQKFQLKTLARCKFLAVWNPIDNPDLVLTLSTKEKEGQVHVSATGVAGEQPVFKFNASFLPQ